MEVARSLKLYGYLVFRPAICDYPEPHTRATLALGRAALHMRLYTPSGEIKELIFKVLLIFFICLYIKHLKPYRDRYEMM
jgi:hypothetical protein